METTLQEKIYQATAKFIELLSLKDGDLLNREYGISEIVSSELFEILAEYFDGEIPHLNAPPIEIAFTRKINGKVPCDIYEMNEPSTWGIDCSLWSNGRPVEPILHLQFSKVGESLNLQYRYIGS